MKASIHVTRAHLTHGTPGSPDDCAIARAIQDSFQDVCNPWVCYDVVYFMDLEGRCYEGVLPTRECEWVRLLFDRNILPGPKTFQLRVSPDHQKNLRSTQRSLTGPSMRKLQTRR
jgi:hypothetical protein